MALAREVTVENVTGIEFTDYDDSVGQMGEKKVSMSPAFWLGKRGRQRSFTEIRPNGTGESMLL